MKTYTDIEQSIRIDKILPRDSYDMYLSRVVDGRTYIPHFGKTVIIDRNMFSYRNGLVVPCWSLAALFDALPKTIGQYFKTMGYFDNFYHCDYLDEDGESVGFGTSADTLIDACVNMILLLHEKSILSY